MLACIAIVLVKGGFLSGISGSFSFIGYKGNTATYGDGEPAGSPSDASAGDAVTGTDKDVEKIESSIKEKSEYDGYSNEKLAWWFKRDTEHGPSGCDDTIDISEYGAYYLDKKCSDQKVMYLTFDCGYENGYTEKMLDVLKKQDVKACFFVTRTYIRDNPEIIKRMKAEGHQVGNHTCTHPILPDKSYEEFIEELTYCADYMKELTGYYMDPYFRPPCGEYSARTLAMAHDLGYKSIFWSVAYLDYDVNKQPGAAYVIEHFNKYYHNGAIILMHNVSSSNAAALDKVLTNMKEKGYRFASLDELK